MKPTIKITGLMIAAIFAVSLSAQNPDCYIKRTYPAAPTVTLRITNKYGDVNFIVNNSDSLAICATVNIDQENKELAKQNLTFITVTILKMKDTITVSTNFDKKFFADAFRAGRKSFSVDILIKGPSSVNADIENEFGNITAEELSGKLDVRLSYGLLSLGKITRGNISPISSISVDNGRVDIRDVTWMSATLRNCPSVEIEKAQALLIKSDFSRLRIGSVNSIVVDSKSDIYTIASLKNIISESRYTSFKIGTISGKMLSKINFGSLSIGELQKDFSSIDITGVNAPITIVTGDKVSFRSDIILTGNNVDLEIKDQPGISRSKSNNSITATGIYGENKLTESIIRVRSASGKITVR